MEEEEEEEAAYSYYGLSRHDPAPPFAPHLYSHHRWLPKLRLLDLVGYNHNHHHGDLQRKFYHVNDVDPDDLLPNSLRTRERALMSLTTTTTTYHSPPHPYHSPHDNRHKRP